MSIFFIIISELLPSFPLAPMPFLILDKNDNEQPRDNRRNPSGDTFTGANETEEGDERGGDILF